jgi:hypothetical protein
VTDPDPGADPAPAPRPEPEPEPDSDTADRAPAWYRRWWSLAGRLTARHPSRLVLARLAVGVLVIVGAASAALFYSDAGGEWQLAVREETQRANLVQEQVRAVYGDEAPLAFRLAAAQVRAEALGRIDDRGRLAESELVLAEQTAFGLSAAAPPGSLIAGTRYAEPSGGFDVVRRVADVLAETRLPDPDRTVAGADESAALGRLTSLGTVLLTAVGGWLLLARVRRSREPDQGEAADGEEGTEDAPPSAEARRPRRIAAVLTLIWALGVVLPFGQLVLSGEEQRAQAQAARIAVSLTSQIAIGLTRTSFATGAGRDADLADAAATAREFAALYTDPVNAAQERELARVEYAVSARLRQIAEDMSRAPAAGDPLEPAVAQALATREDDWYTGLAEQGEAADRANTFGGWGNDVVMLIAVVAVVGWVIEKSGQD